MRGLKRFAFVFLLSATWGSLFAAGYAMATTPEMTTPITRGQGWKPVPKGRLKFKSSGPVCMCADGMSERDIEKAMAKFKANKASNSDAVASHSLESSQKSSQENPPNLGATK